jgi:hypothetical protein
VVIRRETVEDLLRLEDVGDSGDGPGGTGR